MGEKCDRAICPNNCTDKGYCKEGVCECIKGWMGADCSEDSCPNHCSGNGQCFQGECYCQPDWKDLDCGTPKWGIPGLSKPAKYGYPENVRLNETCIAVRVPAELKFGGPKLSKAKIVIALNETCTKEYIAKCGQKWSGWGNSGYMKLRTLDNLPGGDKQLCGIPEGCGDVSVSVYYEGSKEPMTFQNGAAPSASPSPSPPPKDFPIVSSVYCPQECSGRGFCGNFTITQLKYECMCREPYIPPCCSTKDRNDTRPKNIDPLEYAPEEFPFNRAPCTQGDGCANCKQKFLLETSMWENLEVNEQCVWDALRSQCSRLSDQGTIQHAFFCRS
jgi:hypothetical protein